MYIYNLYKYYCTLFYNPIFFITSLMYIFIIKYGHLFFLIILIIYNIFTICYMDNMTHDLPFFDYLPNYLKFDIFFTINDFLHSSIYDQIFLDNDINYDILNSSLDEIDYQILPNQEENFSYLKWEEQKPISYIRWDQLPYFSQENIDKLNNNYSLILETQQTDLIRNFEASFIKFIFWEKDLKKYMPPKYIYWRNWEAVYVKRILYEYKNSVLVFDRWSFLIRCTRRRLYSKKKNGYLFRSFDTYLCWYYKYEYYLYSDWRYLINLKHRRIIYHEFYVRRPWIAGLIILTKCFGGLGLIYLWFHYSPFP